MQFKMIGSESMKFTDDTNPSPKLNMTSLIDVVFLLLIFFMVTTTFEKQAKLTIELPEATEKIITNSKEQLVISINQKGNIYLNSNELVNSQYESIVSSLNRMLKDKEKPPVIIRADENAAHKHVVTVMDVLADMGFKSVSIATTPSK